jgi:plastocyanin
VRRAVLIFALVLPALAVSMAFAAGASAQCQASDVVVHINGTDPSNDFDPDPATVALAGTVCWQNTDPNPFTNSHSATSDTPGIFDSGVLGPGGTFRQTFTADATIRYHCSVHPSMTATLQVGAGSGPGPPRFSSVRVVPSRACVKRSRRCRRPGASVRFTLDRRARVSGTLERLGARAGRIARRFSFSGRAGANRFRLPLRGLRRGRWRLALRAVDSAGNRSALARKRFAIR